MSRGALLNPETHILHTISVKALVAFAAKSGDLDRRFTPAPTGQQGIEGHNRVTKNRPASYRRERAFTLQVDILLLRGRADGYCIDNHCVEEIKTFYGDFNHIPENQRQLHWAQVKCYGWMLCEEEKLEQVNLALVYFQLKEEREYRLEQSWTRADLQRDCGKLVEKYLAWQDEIDQRRALLIPWLNTLQFPHPEFHASQRDMAEAVYKSAATGRVLLAEAPTGTGKTLASLFPALKAMGRDHIDKIFYLTAKTTVKELAFEAVRTIARDTDTPLRVLELTAQEKVCLEPEKRCAGDSCPYAENFYTKLELARSAAYNIPVLDKAALAKLAQDFQICPFYLSMEMCRWADLVVADVNYYFDGSPLLLELTKEMEWRSFLLIDECHNLIERGRMMYSAAINRGLLLAAKKAVPATLKKTLERLNKHWLALLKPLQESPTTLTTLAELPQSFLTALVDFTNQYQEFLQHNPEHSIQQGSPQEFFFSALALQARLEEVNEDFCIDIQYFNSKAEELTVRNLVPAQLLAKRLAYSSGACFFSATLRPLHFYQAMLGLPRDSVALQVSSPFNSAQLHISVAHRLSTRFIDRPASVAIIPGLVAEQLKQVPGNAIIFFSSYAYLQQVENALRNELTNTSVELLVQSKYMSEYERTQFIAQFSNHTNLLGLAVLGGAFSEGIDLPGDALKGVFIATLGLPQINKVNEYLRMHLQNKFNQGYNFTYLYPGIQKVVQAAGRVIRRKDDTGYLCLLDDRFGQTEVKKLLPEWWSIN